MLGWMLGYARGCQVLHACLVGALYLVGATYLKMYKKYQNFLINTGYWVVLDLEYRVVLDFGLH